MKAPSSLLLLDTVVVYGAPSGVDADGAPDTTPGSAGDALTCSVQEVARGQATALMMSPAPFGETQYEVLASADPSVSVAQQKIVWTHHYGVAIDPTVTLISTGPARPPKGLGKRWTISAISAR